MKSFWVKFLSPPDFNDLGVSRRLGQRHKHANMHTHHPSLFLSFSCLEENVLYISKPVLVLTDTSIAGFVVFLSVSCSSLFLP